MSDHIAAVRAQAKSAAERYYPAYSQSGIDSALRASDIGCFTEGAVWVASRMTRKRVALALAKRKARDWDSMSGAMQIAAIHAEYPNADAILELLERGNGEHRAPMQG